MNNKCEKFFNEKSQILTRTQERTIFAKTKALQL